MHPQPRTFKSDLIGILLWFICLAEMCGRALRFTAVALGTTMVVLATFLWHSIQAAKHSKEAAQITSLTCLLVLGVLSFKSGIGSLKLESTARDYVMFWALLGFVGFGVVGFRPGWLYRWLGLEEPEPAKVVPIWVAKGKRR